MPLGQLRAVHVAGLTLALLVGVASVRRGWRPGVVAAGVLAGAVALAPAVAVMRPAPADGRTLVPGARLWRAGGSTVVVVDDLAASPEAFLSSLHRADVRRLDVLVVTRPGPAASADVAALLRRFPPRLLLAPSGHRLAGEVTVPPAGTLVGAGSLALTIEVDGPRLAVAVGKAQPSPIP